MIQGAGLGHGHQCIAAVNQAQNALLVDQGDDHDQCHAEQKIVEEGRQATNQPRSGEVSLRT